MNLLVLFDVVLAEKNVARAARRLGLSASAVSHGLGRLRRLFADPLFLRTPKGVVPTARANELAPAVADILSRVQAVVASSTPFVPATSARRFLLGMADATAVAILPSLLAYTRARAPFVDLSVRQILPFEVEPELESRRLDVAVAAVADMPARFAVSSGFQEHFVVVARVGHPFLNKPSLKRYCDAEHVVVSASGDSRGFVDDILHAQGLKRRVALAVPSFMLALAAAERTDLLAAVPSSLVLTHATRFGVAWVKAPLALPHYQIQTVTTHAALADAGVAWLFEVLVKVARDAQSGAAKAARRRS